MLKHIARLKLGLVVLLGIPLFCSGAFAMGQRYERGNREDNSRRDNRRNNGGDRHYYRDGRWYKHDSRGNEVVSRITVGTRVESLPPRHTTIVIQGDQYQHDGSRYYKQSSDGDFIVVRPPRR